MKDKLDIGVLISGGGTNLQSIIDACKQGRIDGQIRFVGSDRADALGLQRASDNNIPIFVVDYKSIIRKYRESPQRAPVPPDFNLDELKRKQTLFESDADSHRVEVFLATRAIAEGQLLEQMDAYPVDLLVLAGFMRNLSPYFIDRFNTDANRPRIMNIHPALLPAFPGIDGYGDTFRYGCKVGGCTVHFVDYGEDSGPIIGQKAFSIFDEDLDSIRNKGLSLEWQLYPECIQLFAEGRLAVVNMTHTLDNGEILQRKVVRIVRDD